MTEDDREQPAELADSQNSQPDLSVGYDSYRSLADSNLLIFVPKNAVPPFRLKAGGWELLQSSVELSSAAKAHIAEAGFFMSTANPTNQGELVSKSELVPSGHDKPEPSSLEVEFALVIARMIDSMSNSPSDMRQVIYDLARYKLREQLPNADIEETQRTQQALETAIRGVESFSEKRVHLLAPQLQSQLNGPGTSTDDAGLSVPELLPRPVQRAPLTSGRNIGDSKHKKNPAPFLPRLAALITICVVLAAAISQRERLRSLADNLPRLEWKSAVEKRVTTPEIGEHPVSEVSERPAPAPSKPSMLLPKDYGVYAVSNDATTELSLLPIRPPDIRVAISAALTIPGRTVLPNGHPKFIVFRRDLASSIGDRAEVRIIAKVAREFSRDIGGKKPSDDNWVIRNIAFPFRLSPVNENPEMYELHSEDPALELPPGRYALVLKNQAYDFSVDGEVVDPRQCIERIVASEGIFYSSCKKP